MTVSVAITRNCYEVILSKWRHADQLHAIEYATSDHEVLPPGLLDVADEIIRGLVKGVMASTSSGSYRLGLASGRYDNASEVPRGALRLMEERERGLAALDVATERGVADIEAGRVQDADTVFDRLEERYARMAGGAAVPGTVTPAVPARDVTHGSDSLIMT